MNSPILYHMNTVSGVWQHRLSPTSQHVLHHTVLKLYLLPDKEVGGYVHDEHF